jgi:hypothetical protein
LIGSDLPGQVMDGGQHPEFDGIDENLVQG